MEDRVPDTPRPTLLERLDLALAGRLAERIRDENSDPEAVVQSSRPDLADAERQAWIAGLLGLRGFRVTRDDVARILAGTPGRFRREHQEFKFVLGFGAMLVELEDRAAGGRAPDGWWLVDCFQRVTAGIERFRGNVLRRDQPWDALLRVPYPDPSEISARLDAFHEDQRFGDDPQTYEDLHPVRQGVRAMWRFARLAPFPDFNLPFAALAFCGILLARGYPALVPQSGDRVRLERLVRGTLPVRSLPIEARLLDQVEMARSGRV